MTEEIVDIDARLKNLFSLRDRFRALLEKGIEISEILEIEKELSRIQTEIDAIEGRRKLLKHQAALSSIDITIQQEVIYGPLGYGGKALYWLFEKLFIIQ